MQVTCYKHLVSLSNRNVTKSINSDDIHYSRCIT